MKCPALQKLTRVGELGLQRLLALAPSGEAVAAPPEYTALNTLMPNRQCFGHSRNHRNFMSNAALHALGPNLKFVVVYFVPAQPTDFLAPATGEQTQPHNTVILTTSIGGFPDRLQFLICERAFARLLHALEGEGDRVAVRFD